MGPVQALWASVQNNPALMRRANGWLTIFWIVMTPVSYFMGWLDSVVYVSALSLWALVAGHWSAWQSARVEVKQEAEIRSAAERDLPGEIIERLVDETTVQPDAQPSADGPRADGRGVRPAGGRQDGRPSWRSAGEEGPAGGLSTAAVAQGLAGTPGCTCSCHADPAAV